METGAEMERTEDRKWKWDEGNSEQTQEKVSLFTSFPLLSLDDPKQDV